MSAAPDFTRTGEAAERGPGYRGGMAANPTQEATPMQTKITGLTALNVQALEQIQGAVPVAGNLTLTATTATWDVPATTALDDVTRAMARLASRKGHPYHSLHAVRRKLARAAEQQGATEAAPAATNREEATVATATKSPAKAGTGKAAGKPAGKAQAKPAAPKTKAQLEAEMKKHLAGYKAYQVHRAEARKGTAGAAEQQEKERPHYTAYKRAYTALLALKKASGGQG